MKEQNAKEKEYNSLASAILFLIIDAFFSVKTNPQKENSMSLFDLSQKLGKKGRKLQDRYGLLGALVLLFFIFFLLCVLLYEQGPVFWPAVLLVGCLIIGVIIGYLTIRARKESSKKTKKWFF